MGGAKAVDRTVPQKSVCPSSVGSTDLHMMCASALGPRYGMHYIYVGIICFNGISDGYGEGHFQTDDVGRAKAVSRI